MRSRTARTSRRRSSWPHHRRRGHPLGMTRDRPRAASMRSTVAPTLTPPEAPRRSGRLEERFRGRAERAIAKRRVFRYLASALLVTSVGAGILVRAIDHKDFHT